MLTTTLSFFRVIIWILKESMMNTNNENETLALVELPNPEFAELLKQRNLWQHKVAQAKKELLDKNMRLVFAIAKQYTHQGLNFMALIREGSLGLTEAIDKFEFRKNFQFATYATWCIRQSIAKAIAKGGCNTQKTSSALNQVTSEIKSELPYNVAPALHHETRRLQSTLTQKSVALKSTTNDTSMASYEELRKATQQILASLPAREATVLKMRFGINMPHEYTIEEISEQVGITPTNIRQIEMKALRKLQALHSSRALECLNHEAINA